MDLVTRFWNYCHTLRHEGVDYSDYIEELTYLLFLKIAAEKGITIPIGCKWSDLINTNDDKLLARYNSILTKLSKSEGILGDIFSKPIAKIRTISSLRKLLILIDEVNWSDYNEDVLGAMFEGLIEKAVSESKKGAGQYFSPRPLIESIVRVMKPNPLESKNFTLSDVACGTGGFIISSFEWLKKNTKINRLSAAEKKKIFEKTFYGQELVVRPRRMAQMNMYLHGITPTIKLGDTIYGPLSRERYSCILTNPPFGTKGASEIPERDDFKIKTSSKQLNFVQHVFSSLKDKGRAAIILPDNVLFEEKAKEMWSYLMPLCNVHTILRLPNGTFSPYAQGVKANVIFIQKGIPTKSVWIFDARSNIEGVTKNDRPLQIKHFTEFEASYGIDPNGQGKRIDRGVHGRFRKFSFEEIKRNNYRLDVSWLADENISRLSNNDSPEIILSNAITEVQNMLLTLKSALKTFRSK